jgi:hypothetical protein
MDDIGFVILGTLTHDALIHYASLTQRQLKQMPTDYTDYTDYTDFFVFFIICVNPGNLWTYFYGSPGLLSESYCFLFSPMTNDK